MKNVSVNRAILIGKIWVNGPVLPIMFTPLFVLIVFIKDSQAWKGSMNPSQFIIFLTVIFIGFALSWLWWSINVPKWRLWAYQRVTDIEALQQAAVSAGITWPKNNIFEKTEIKSAKHRSLEKKLEENKLEN